MAVLRAGQSRNRIPVRSVYSVIVQTVHEAHTASYTTGMGSLSQGKIFGGVTLTTHLHQPPKLQKEYDYTSAPPLGLHGLF